MQKYKFATWQKRLMTSFKLNIGQKMLSFCKAISENLKIGKLSVTLATWNFKELFEMKFDLKSN